MRLRAVVAGALIAAAVIPPTATAKLIPRLDRSSARPGDSVGVTFGQTYGYLMPIFVDLLPSDAADEVESRRDPRVIPLLRIRRGSYSPTRLRFVVPPVRPGTYVLAAWFKGTATHTWANALASLASDAVHGPRITLRIVARR